MAVKVFTLDLTPEQSVRLADELGQLVDAAMPMRHVAAPISSGVIDTVAYLAEAYVSGESLDAALRQYGPAPAPDAARLVSHVADALEAAARAGVFHGSLHPRDILVTPGETHLTGLGVAQAIEKQGVRPPVRRPYAAPERESGEAWGSPADVFALAAIAHEVLTGKRALPGTEEPFPGLEALKGFDTTLLRDALDAAMDVDPARRPSASEFAAAFAASLGAAGGETPAAGAKSKRRAARARAVPKLPGLEDPLSVPAAGIVPDAQDAAPEVVLDAVPEVVLDDEPLPETLDAEPTMAGPGPTVRERDGADLVLNFDLAPADALAREPLVADTTSDLADLLMAQPPPSRVATSPAGSFDLVAVAPEAPSPGPAFEPERAAEPVHEPDPEPLASPVDEPAPPRRERAQTRDVVAPARRTHGPTADDLRPIGSPSDEVPRAIDPAIGGRGGSATRRVEPYRPLPPKPRLPVIPVAAGLAAGLLLGGVVGYWLGARSVPAPVAATVPAPAAVPVTQIPETPEPIPVTATGATPEPATTTAVPVNEPPVATPVPPVAKPAAPRVPATRTGSITVRSTPSKAYVFVDGKTRGTTPRSLAKLPLGTYTIRVTHQGYQAYERKVTLTAAEPNVRLNVTLDRPPTRPAAPKPTVDAPAAAPSRPAAGAVAPSTQSPLVQAAQVAQGVGALEIDTRPPGARIRLDGAAVGVSPAVLDNVKAGTHTLRLELDGFRAWTTTVSIKAGTRTRIAASLERSSTR